MRLYSWNVNGIRAVTRKGFLDWLKRANPDVLCVQEVRSPLDDFDRAGVEALGYHVAWVEADKKGYSGVMTLSRRPPEAVEVGLGDPRLDGEGRVVMTAHGGVRLFNGYFPNGGRDCERVPFKMDFYDRLIAVLKPLVEAGERVIVAGDFNTAHMPADLARPGANAKTSGFTPEERRKFDELLALGLVDVFRALNPDAEGQYTWWSNRSGARARNIGWRIDYHLISANLLPAVRAVNLYAEVEGSDHCPIELELADDALGGP